jgi:hypothetical protein
VPLGECIPDGHLLSLACAKETQQAEEAIKATISPINFSNDNNFKILPQCIAALNFVDFLISDSSSLTILM